MPLEESIWTKLRTGWQEPYFNRINRFRILCCKLKGILLYRLVFKQFGKGSYIHKPLYISNATYITIGERVSIFGGIRLEVIRDNENRIPELFIGNNTNIEQNVHIVCHSRIRIGNDVSITGNCAIVDVTHPYSDINNRVKIGARIQDDDSFVEIGDGSWIGYGSVILPNVRIGKYVVVGANSVVVKDIPDYSIAAGSPAKVIKQFDPVTGAWIKVNTISLKPSINRD
jgi:acetyltransferase-like isoleucine patch superfamily enzyme